MKNFSYKIIKYLVITLAICFLVEYIFDEIFTKHSKRSVHNIKNENYEIVILGNSRVQHNIVPSVFDSLLSMSAINLAIAGPTL